MKSLTPLAIVAILSLLTIGCTTVETASKTEASSTKIASSEQLNAGLAPIAAPPSSAWGGNSRPYSY